MFVFILVTFVLFVSTYYTMEKYPSTPFENFFDYFLIYMLDVRNQKRYDKKKG